MYLKPRSHLTGALGVRRIAGLSLTSTVVGMICPGLHSIYSGLETTIVGDDGREFWFRTTGVDERFNMTTLEAGGAGISCRITAFERSPPIEADSMATLASLVMPGEFAGSTVAILGGSRGLGAATAKLIAAGGGRVVITYARGHDDAQRLRDEIRAACGASACDIHPFDFHLPITAQMTALPEGVTHLYYFATPLIGRQKAPAYSRALFGEFVHAYVDAFAEACAALRSRCTGVLRVFYPSSVYVAERPPNMAEYAMAKAAGEVLCEELARTDAGLRILVARLPRVVTDQTAAVMSREAENAAVTMLPHIRALG
ncbi:MAG TPA: SDR family oxidoreductase [Steroidobacteraceae bacterium]|nr:SDR family oxidoreductase [Steroidobacteraceae bacterium]